MATVLHVSLPEELEAQPWGMLRLGARSGCGCCVTSCLPPGNYAFAKDYDQVVRDTWSIINNQASEDLLFISEPCLAPHPADWVSLAAFLTGGVSPALATAKESFP